MLKKIIILCCLFISIFGIKCVCANEASNIVFMTFSDNTAYKKINSSAGLLKFNKSKDEIEYEQNKNEYTFKPNLILSNCNIRTSNRLSIQDKTITIGNNNEHCSTNFDEQAYVERMKKGRSENERIKQAKLYRSSVTPNKNKSSTGIAFRRRPVLIIDIEIFGDNKRIFIYKNDNPALVSEKFIREHKIKDKNLIEQIKEMVYEEMKMVK